MGYINNNSYNIRDLKCLQLGYLRLKEETGDFLRASAALSATCKG